MFISRALQHSDSDSVALTDTEQWSALHWAAACPSPAFSEGLDEVLVGIAAMLLEADRHALLPAMRSIHGLNAADMSLSARRRPLQERLEKDHGIRISGRGTFWAPQVRWLKRKSRHPSSKQGRG